MVTNAPKPKEHRSAYQLPSNVISEKTELVSSCPRASEVCLFRGEWKLKLAIEEWINVTKINEL